MIGVDRAMRQPFSFLTAAALQAVASIFGTVASLMLLAVPALMAGFRTDKSALQAWSVAFPLPPSPSPSTRERSPPSPPNLA